MLLVCSQPDLEFRYPIDIEYAISKEKVELWDTIDVNIKVTLEADQDNYNEKFQYVLINQNNIVVYTYIRWNTPPSEMERNILSFKEKYRNDRNWIILSSDDDTIIDNQNITSNYSLKIKIINLPNSQYIKFPILFFKFDYTEDYGGYINYINSESKAKAHHDYYTFYLEIEISNPNIVTYNDSIPREIIREDSIDFEIVTPGIVTEEFYNKEDKTK